MFFICTIYYHSFCFFYLNNYDYSFKHRQIRYSLRFCIIFISIWFFNIKFSQKIIFLLKILVF